VSITPSLLGFSIDCFRSLLQPPTPYCTQLSVTSANHKNDFSPCSWHSLAAGLAYYIALKVPEGLARLDVLKQQYDEAWDRAAGEDQEKAAVRFVPRQMFIGGGT